MKEIPKHAQLLLDEIDGRIGELEHLRAQIEDFYSGEPEALPVSPRVGRAVVKPEVAERQVRKRIKTSAGNVLASDYERQAGQARIMQAVLLEKGALTVGDLLRAFGAHPSREKAPSKPTFSKILRMFPLVFKYEPVGWTWSATREPIPSVRQS